MSDSALEGTEIDDTEPCPCDSGRLYGDCCKSQLGQLVRLPNGRIVDRRPLPKRAIEIIGDAEAQFSEVFGRKAKKGDRVFLSAHLDGQSEVIEAMFSALDDGVGRPELVYAYRETGLLPTEATYPLMSARDREDWESAIEKFEELVADGIDPFTGLKAEVRDLLECLNEFCQDSAIHMGSYVDRYRKNRKLDIHEFSQVLVLSRSQKLLLLLKEKLGPNPKSDALILVRSLLECYLVHEYLRSGVKAGLYCIAAASQKKDGGLFSYKAGRNGKLDRRTVICRDTGDELPAYVSFYTMAAQSSHSSDVVIFDRIYARLSDEVHFSFKNWEDYWQGKDVIRNSTEGNPAEIAGVFLLAVAMLADSVATSETHTMAVRRDARFLFRRARQALSFLLYNVDEPPSEMFFDEELILSIGRRLKTRRE